MLITAIPSYYDGCWYYRCYIPGTPNGWFLPKDLGKEIDYDKVAEMTKMSQAVLFQRPSDDVRLASMHLLKKMGKKIIYDNDDTYLPGLGIPLEKFTDNAVEITKKLNQNLYEAIRISDLVITTTEFLADEYRKLNDNVIVLPNYINPIEVEDKIPNDTGKKRIGMVGSVLSNEDYLHVKDQIRRLVADGHQLVILGIKAPDGSHSKAYDEDYEFWTSLNPEWHPHVPVAEYYHAVNKLKLDVMLIPRKDNYFNRCKSNIKFLEASLLEIPVIAQGFKDGKSPYQVNPQDKHYMHIVIEDEDWYNTATAVLNDDVGRIQLAKKAKQYVLENYNINDHYHKWNIAINKI